MKTRRPVLLLAGALCAVLSVASAARAPQTTTPDHAKMTDHHDGSAACAFKEDMRRLWTDHVVWTRDYIIAALDGTPDAQAAANRLMKNQEGIVNAVGKYYGAPAGQQLTTLKEHISIAVDVIKAAKANDTDALKKADDRWQQNGQQIADFLSKANPTNWPQATLRDMMKTHLSTTTAEVTARLKKDWDGDVRAYDAVYDHILKMSDALATGIIKQFPAKFAS